MTTWFQKYVDKYLYVPRNDAVNYGVVVKQSTAAAAVAFQYARCIGVWHLLPEENRGQHNIFVVMLNDDGQMIPSFKLSWTWEGRTVAQPAWPINCDKPSNEPTGNVAMNSGQKISIWPADFAGDTVENLHTGHADERAANGELWNSVGHHSFLVVYQLKYKDNNDAPKPPTDVPAPLPSQPELADGLYLVKNGVTYMVTMEKVVNK